MNSIDLRFGSDSGRPTYGESSPAVRPKRIRRDLGAGIAVGLRHAVPVFRLRLEEGDLVVPPDVKRPQRDEMLNTSPDIDSASSTKGPKRKRNSA